MNVDILILLVGFVSGMREVKYSETSQSVGNNIIVVVGPVHAPSREVSAWVARHRPVLPREHTGSPQV